MTSDTAFNIFLIVMANMMLGLGGLAAAVLGFGVAGFALKEGELAGAIFSAALGCVGTAVLCALYAYWSANL